MSNNREILYIKHNLEVPWYGNFPEQNWLLFVITEYSNKRLFKEIARRAIENNVVYVCSTGEASEEFHDSFDSELEIRDVENQYLPPFCIMTTSEQDLEAEFWFSINTAFGESEEIHKIICLDLTTENLSFRLKSLIPKINEGWIPQTN